ncbi:MAG: phycobilisome degradation protein NblA [Oscillatoria sp. SIO1A7]|nr:phycobilisome degradation protein NblA [Oscillatoria sp. SIO1A7]
MEITAANLTLEQEFKLKVLADQIKQLSKEEAQECLFKIVRQGMIKDNLYRQLFNPA